MGTRGEAEGSGGRGERQTTTGWSLGRESFKFSICGCAAAVPRDLPPILVVAPAGGVRGLRQSCKARTAPKANWDGTASERRAADSWPLSFG